MLIENKKANANPQKFNFFSIYFIYVVSITTLETLWFSSIFKIFKKYSEGVPASIFNETSLGFLVLIISK